MWEIRLPSEHLRGDYRALWIGPLALSVLEHHRYGLTCIERSLLCRGDGALDVEQLHIHKVF
jgi:hypothetical protein